MVMVCILLALILSIAMPVFTQTVSRQRMIALVNELNGFLHRSVSEAALRNHHLYILIDKAENTEGLPLWHLKLFDADQDQESSPILALESDCLEGISFVPHYLNQRIEIDGVREKISNGHLLFYPQQHVDQALKIITSFGASRIRVCGAKQEVYGYPQC
jgi:type IV fimbrial biogenesis protein FimT